MTKDEISVKFLFLDHRLKDLENQVAGLLQLLLPLPLLQQLLRVGDYQAPAEDVFMGYG